MLQGRPCLCLWHASDDIYMCTATAFYFVGVKKVFVNPVNSATRCTVCTLVTPNVVMSIFYSFNPYRSGIKMGMATCSDAGFVVLRFCFLFINAGCYLNNGPINLYTDGNHM